MSAVALVVATVHELLGMISELRSAIAPRLANLATPDRARYPISPILFPVEKPSSSPEAG